MYGYYGNLFIDLYSEEHAVPCSHNRQTYHVSNSKPADDASGGICNPHIPIKAPQVRTPFMCCTVTWLLSLCYSLLPVKVIPFLAESQLIWSTQALLGYRTIHCKR